jgi:hypothetical protein
MFFYGFARRAKKGEKFRNRGPFHVVNTEQALLQ